jgi:hypothetical protein
MCYQHLSSVKFGLHSQSQFCTNYKDLISFYKLIMYVMYFFKLTHRTRPQENGQLEDELRRRFKESLKEAKGTCFGFDTVDQELIV